MPPKDFSGYQYNAMSSLVTTADRPRHRDHEPTGEAESLAGRIGIKEMGTRAFREEVDVAEKRKKADDKRERRDNRARDAGDERKKRGTMPGGMRYGDVLEATQDRASSLLSPLAVCSSRLSSRRD